MYICIFSFKITQITWNGPKTQILVILHPVRGKEVQWSKNTGSPCHIKFSGHYVTSIFLNLALFSLHHVSKAIQALCTPYQQDNTHPLIHTKIYFQLIIAMDARFRRCPAFGGFWFLKFRGVFEICPYIYYVRGAKSVVHL